ncbi:MAG: hypothetical protein U0531_20295 [Dehalococcoidia bacterium]
MPIDTAVVGESAGTGRFVVQARHAMAYAAATGDRNPRYFDDTRPGGVGAAHDGRAAGLAAAPAARRCRARPQRRRDSARCTPART